MCPAIVSGIVTGNGPDSYWPILSLSRVTVPEVLGNVYSVQFLCRFCSNEFMYDQVVSIFLTMGGYFPSFQKPFYVLGLKTFMYMVEMTKVLVTIVLSKKRVLTGAFIRRITNNSQREIVIFIRLRDN